MHPHCVADSFLPADSAIPLAESIIGDILCSSIWADVFVEDCVQGRFLSNPKPFAEGARGRGPQSEQSLGERPVDVQIRQSKSTTYLYSRLNASADVRGQRFYYMFV